MTRGKLNLFSSTKANGLFLSLSPKPSMSHPPVSSWFHLPQKNGSVVEPIEDKDGLKALSAGAWQRRMSGMSRVETGALNCKVSSKARTSYILLSVSSYATSQKSPQSCFSPERTKDKFNSTCVGKKPDEVFILFLCSLPPPSKFDSSVPSEGQCSQNREDNVLLCWLISQSIHILELSQCWFGAWRFGDEWDHNSSWNLMEYLWAFF